MNFDECFFCGKKIKEKITREHIFSDKFLLYLDLKQERMLSSLPMSTTYSKVKVPAHSACNNEKGSKFEDDILKLIRSMDSNLDHLSDIHNVSDEPINGAIREAFTFWMAKLYYGMIYWEAGLKNHADLSYQSSLRKLLCGDDFAYFRKCFVEDIAFKVPSSLYHFHIPEPIEPALRFDFGTGLPYGLIFIRIRRHLLITSLGDAFLVREWFTEKQVQHSQTAIYDQSFKDPVAYLHPVSHIWAIRELLPVQPNIEYHETCIKDISRINLNQCPEIDGETINLRANELFQQFAEKWKTQNT